MGECTKYRVSGFDLFFVMRVSRDFLGEHFDRTNGVGFFLAAEFRRLLHRLESTVEGEVEPRVATKRSIIDGRCDCIGDRS
jgi:hypothetical protein